MYCTVEDIYSQVTANDLLALTDDLNSGNINDDIILQKIELASALINGYIRNKVELPLSEIPMSLKQISLDIVTYYLFQRRLPAPIPESIRDCYIEAMKRLGDIQTGKFNLGIESYDSDAQVPVKQNIITTKTSDDRVFSSDVLNQF